ncbi:cation transporter, partial [Halorubrum sp. AJ67]|uniref:cation transporter n=1 Tax=Halorubrum sp. AJ67 TaxID=1173487 RepID=UPI00064EA9B5
MSDSREPTGPDDGPTEPSGGGSDRPDGTELRLSVPDMDCSSCAGKVEGALDREGVLSVDTRPTTGVVVLTYDPERTDVEALTAAVERAGYAVADAESDGVADDLFTSPRAIGTAVGGVLLAVGPALEWLLPGLDPTLVTLGGIGFLGPYVVTGASVAYLLAVAVAGPPILRNGFYSLRGLSLDIDLL